MFLFTELNLLICRDTIKRECVAFDLNTITDDKVLYTIAYVIQHCKYMGNNLALCVWNEISMRFRDVRFCTDRGVLFDYP